jgi:hypothetical protein
MFDANEIKHAKKHAKSLFWLVYNGCEVFMKAKLPQSHLVLLSFASLEVYLASFSFRFVSHPLIWLTLFPGIILNNEHLTSKLYLL